jgi:hypothetical protein
MSDAVGYQHCGHGTDVFVASNIPHRYPLVLQKPATACRRIRETAETYILDSGIGDDTTNADVLALAADLDADYVIPCDELHDQAATTAAVEAFLELLEEHRCTATPLIPLQPPHAKHYRALSGHSHYCLGGMAFDETTDDQAVRWIREFRKAAGPDPYVHALGIGGGSTIVDALAGTGLIDSVDCATPELAAQFGCVLNDHLGQEPVLIHQGDGLQRRTRPLAEFNAWQIQDAWRREATDSPQQTLSEVVQ